MHTVFITTYQGLEPLLAKEISALGIPESRIEMIKRGVRVLNCSLEDVYRFNYQLRTALRVLLNLSKFRLKNTNDLKWKSKQVNWHHWFSPDKRIKIDAVVNNSREFSNSKYAAQLVKDGVVDCFKNTRGERPVVDLKSPEVRIQVLISKDNVTLSLDTSGDSLHKRGYKTSSFKAPLSEVLAAGIAMLSEVNNYETLFDPMCGSGTLLTEAYLIKTNTAPGKWRESFGFEHFLKFEEDDFLKIRSEAIAKEKPLKGSICFNDLYRSNVEQTQMNLKKVGFYAGESSYGDFLKSNAPHSGGLLLMNPPYDQRLEQDDVNSFYKAIGDTLKQQYKGWTAGIFSGNMEALKNVGLKTSKKHPLFNGPLESKLHLYELY
jgi:putative N6-adenine-specific DNA methylase